MSTQEKKYRAEDYIKRITRILQLAETMTEGLLEEYEENMESLNGTKDLPAQLLRLLQLLEKLFALLEQLQQLRPEAAVEVNYEIIRKYLEKRRDGC